MAVKIGSNIPSLQAQRRLSEASAAQSKVYERLSSGLRINRASDDAAGLAIAKALDASARIFNQGIRNLNDGISYTAIAGGAVHELKSILYRQRELATQSSNGTYSDKQRSALEGELKELSAEWNRVLDSTTFNGRRVFSASEGSLSLQGGIGTEAVLQAAFGSDQAAAQDDIRRVSTSSDGTQGNDSSWGRPSLSADGRYVAFQSLASNLVAGDTNGAQDIFVKDLQSGSITLVSTDAAGGEANGYSYSPSLSADGRYVAFLSYASNLVAGDTNGRPDIFVKDLQSGSITRASTDASGGEANGNSSFPVLSADGRYVAFQSDASNLVAGDTNGSSDIFLRDLQTGSITRVSTDALGGEANSGSSTPVFSANGRYVAFKSAASNLVAGDTNGMTDIFVKDLQTGSITRANTDAMGGEANHTSDSPALSADGRYVAFGSWALNLVADDTNERPDIFVKDLQNGSITRVSTDASGGEANNQSSFPVISADGRYVAFNSLASNLVAGDTNGDGDNFVKDLQSGSIIRVSINATGGEANGNSGSPIFSADSRYVAFYSYASNLVAGDTNGAADFFATGNPFAEWSTVSRNQWLSVATRDEALKAQTRIDNYLSELKIVEGAMGAIEARLGTAVSNLASLAENFRAAESRITDADMGEEAANLTRTQIVQQAAASVLSQANQQPLIVLQLLGA